MIKKIKLMRNQKMITESNLGLWFTGLAGALLAFFAPIALILHVTIAVILLDCVTAIFKAIKIAKEQDICKDLSPWKKFICKLKVIKSNKLRRTALKLFFYVMTIMLVYAAEIALFGISVYITNFAAFIIIFSELISIAENCDKSLGTTLFTKLITQVRKMFEASVTKKIEDNK